MSVTRTWLAGLAVLGLAAGLLAACSGSGDEGDGEAEARTVDEILADASVAMAEVSSATFTIEQGGGPVFIDDAGQIAFQAAEGRYAEPASADAVVTVEALGFVTEVGAVAIDGMLWFTNPLSGEWLEAPEGFAFDPANLFDADVGLPAVLAEAQGQAELVAPTATDGATGEGGDEAGGQAHRIRTTVSAERVSVLTGGLVAVETETVLVIDPVTDRVSEVSFELPVDDTVSSWTVLVTSYDTDVVIEAPQVGATS